MNRNKLCLVLAAITFGVAFILAVMGEALGKISPLELAILLGGTFWLAAQV
jgi:hypothetical protein